MNTFTNGAKSVGGGIYGGVSGVAGGVASGVGQGVSAITGQGQMKPEDVKDPKSPNNIANASNSEQIDNSGQPPTSDEPPQPQAQDAQQPQKSDGGGGGLLGSVTGGVSSGFSAVGSGVTAVGSGVGSGVMAVGKGGAALVTGAAEAGVNIGQSVGKAGLDLTQNVTSGAADLTGTVLGGVIATAATTTGAVFEPVGAGLTALEGLQNIGPGIKYINGLPLGAVSEMAKLTTKALNMSGKTPTFFDPNADGIVGIPDTTKGLILLGLDESTAGYAAIALHGVFSYPTSDSWVPNPDKTMPIHVDKMKNTRWGKNWGNFERLDWVDDMNIDDFFADEAKTQTYAEYWKQSRQYFGILLLIFEWGTTWPFFMPDIPIQQIPFSDELGTVVRKAILPTILANFQKARDADPEAKNKSRSPPSKEAPDDPKDA